MPLVQVAAAVSRKQPASSLVTSTLESSIPGGHCSLPPECRQTHILSSPTNHDVEDTKGKIIYTRIDLV